MTQVWVLFTILQWGAWVPLHMDAAPFVSRQDCETFGGAIQLAVPDRVGDHVCIQVSKKDYMRLRETSNKQIDNME